MDAFISLNNKWLVVRSGVILTDTIDPVIAALDIYYQEAALMSYVTSGLRKPADQLKLIQRFAIMKAVAREFPEIVSAGLNDKKFFHDQAVYAWQPAWSRLLSIGIIINPPIAAIALFDYFRDGVNKKGDLIQRSPHFTGTAFDVEGGTEEKLNAQTAVLKGAMVDIEGLSGYLVERENDCLHVDCSPF